MKINNFYQPTYISLFSSAGIGCFGFKVNNFQCIATNELLPERMNVQKANNKCKYQTGYILGDITNNSVKEKIFEQITFWEKNENIKCVDVVVATPPCQGMSTANYKKKDNEIIRNSLVIEAIEIIEQISPNVFIFENVPAFLKSYCIDSDETNSTIENTIKRHLENEYNIYWDVINFKDYGVASSRPRTLVIGTKKSFKNISPLNIFPISKNTKTVRDVIGDLPQLEFGEIAKNDIYHGFRIYPKYMQEWIHNIKEGKSAFQNEEQFMPYKLINGVKHELKGAYLGNKMKRMEWDKPAPCIATRNDQLASQSTIHPSQDRVLSIRELMRVMSIPDEFLWSETIPLNSWSTLEKKEYLRKNELNIRRSIGEAVPTEIFSSIALNIINMLDFESYSDGKTPKFKKKTSISNHLK
jgi:DNA (cytosine-5)-methyltransferase 1